MGASCCSSARHRSNGISPLYRERRSRLARSLAIHRRGQPTGCRQHGGFNLSQCSAIGGTADDGTCPAGTGSGPAQFSHANPLHPVSLARRRRGNHCGASAPPCARHRGDRALVSRVPINHCEPARLPPPFAGKPAPTGNSVYGGVQREAVDRPK